MDDINLFNATAYFKNLCLKNKLARDNAFYTCGCGGINALEPLLQEFQRVNAFFAIDDTNDGVTERRSGGFFKHRTFTIFVLMRHRFGDEEGRKTALSICRELCRQIHSKMLVDADNADNEMAYMGVDNVMSREISRYFLSGCTGLYFMVDMLEPINLCYDESEWIK